MPVGIVVVSHSAQLAQGVTELAGQMAAGMVKIAAAGGGPDGTLGTSAELIETAITEVYGDDGVLVLVDLGSAVMSAEVAIESLPAERQGRVLISNAPLVEGAVVAGVEASIGTSLENVEAAAVRACTMPKVERQVAQERIELEVTNEHGLHARPAALFVQTAARFHSGIRLRNLNKAAAPAVNAKSIMDVLTAGVNQGSRIELTADGEDAAAAITALRNLVENGLLQR